MGPGHLTADGEAAASGGRPGTRLCLRKGCGQRFQPRRWNQRYCQEPECLREVKRWQSAKRQRKRRSQPGGRQRHAEAERQRRQRGSTRVGGPEHDAATGPAATSPAGAWSRSKRNLPADLCDRPGCYEPPCDSPRVPSRYCGDACRTAMRRVCDRERKCLARKTQAGRLKRRREYQAAKVRRCRAVPRNAAGDSPSSSASPQGSVLAYRRPADPALGFVGPQEIPPDDPETTSGARPRAPPSP